MNRIFLCENEKNIRSVYCDDERVYTKAEVLSTPELFQNTEYIFSTWGMPQFTEEEIKRYLPSLKAVFYGAGSVQAFARPFLNCGVKVFSAWAANAVPVAEYTVAQILLAKPGVRSDSCNITLVPVSFPAIATGTQANPPLQKINAGFSRWITLIA